MKTSFKFMALMMILFGLISCGAKNQSEKELSITGSFLVAAGVAYNGGLVVKGFKVGGTPAESFIRSVTGSSTVRVVIPDGAWDISVVGWTAPAAAEIMDGNPECGRSLVNFDAVTLSANINISHANCIGADFSGAGFTNVTAPINIHPLRIVPCGSFYAHTTATAYAPIAFATSHQYCQNADHPADLISKIGSVRIEFLNKDLSAPPSPVPGLSVCIPAAVSQGGAFDFGSRKIPVKNLPFKITLYHQPSCNENSVSSSLFVPHGMNNGIVDGDSLLGNNGGNNFFVPTGETRRGYSPFYSIMPKISCSNEFCLGYPTGVGAYDHFLQKKMDGGNYVVEAEFKKEIVSSCTNGTLAVNTYNSVWSVTSGLGLSITDGMPTNGTTLTISQKCDGNEKTLVARMSVAGTLPASFSFTYGSDTRKIKIFTDGNRTADMFMRTWEVIGAQHGKPQGEWLNDSKDGDDKSFGILSLVRELLGPKIIGGLFDKSLTCANVVGEKAVQVMDEGSLKTYKGIISNISPYTIPDLFENSVALTGSSDSNYTKRLIACEVTGPGSCLEKARMDFSCTKKAGRIRDLHVDTEDGKTRNEIKIIIWNTEDSATARAEQYSFNQETNSSNVLVRENNSFNRVVKLGESTVEVNGMNYNYELNGSNPNYRGERYFTRIESGEAGWQPTSYNGGDPGIEATYLTSIAASPVVYPSTGNITTCITGGTLVTDSSVGCPAFAANTNTLLQNQLPVLYTPSLVTVKSELGSFDLRNMKSSNLYPVMTQSGLFP